jgi:hypothetical protein
LSFYFPLLFLIPEFEGDSLVVGGYGLAKRKWETSIFDFATLATKHKLHAPYRLLDVILSSCNLEVSIEGALSREEAINTFENLRLGLYLESVSPFLAPYISTHSINEYSGINGRDSVFGAEGLPEGMRTGITSETATIEIWLHELALQCMLRQGQTKVTADKFQAACDFAKRWALLKEENPSSKTLQGAAFESPKMAAPAQALLQVWTSLEGLFPKVQTELSFRVAAYLATLIEGRGGRFTRFHSIRASYAKRSNAAHGERKAVSQEDFWEAWDVLLLSADAIAKRGALPGEEELLRELFSVE